MKNKLTRRGFLGIIGGLIAAATLTVKGNPPRPDTVNALKAEIDKFHKKLATVKPGSVVTSGAKGSGAELARAIGVR